MIEATIDRWAADPAVRSVHRRASAAAPDALWRAAQAVRLCDTRTLGHLVRWRIPGTPSELTFHEMFRRYPFTELESGESWSLSGLCGRIWTAQRDYPRLSGPGDFEAWDEPGTVKVLFAHWTRPAAGGGSELVSEARITAVDRRAGVRVRALWAIVGKFERLIGAEPLVIAARRAEAG